MFDYRDSMHDVQFPMFGDPPVLIVDFRIEALGVHTGAEKFEDGSECNDSRRCIQRRLRMQRIGRARHFTKVGGTMGGETLKDVSEYKASRRCIQP